MLEFSIRCFWISVIFSWLLAKLVGSESAFSLTWGKGGQAGVEMCVQSGRLAGCPSFQDANYLSTRGRRIPLWPLNYPPAVCISEVLAPSPPSEIDSPDAYLFLYHIHPHFSGRGGKRCGYSQVLQIMFLSVTTGLWGFCLYYVYLPISALSALLLIFIVI